jgi:GTPase
VVAATLVRLKAERRAALVVEQVIAAQAGQEQLAKEMLGLALQIDLEMEQVVVQVDFRPQDLELKQHQPDRAIMAGSEELQQY